MKLSYWDVPNKREVVLKQFQKTIAVNQEFDVELLWTKQELRVAVGRTDPGEASIPQPIGTLFISATTGDLRCQDAVFGTARF